MAVKISVECLACGICLESCPNRAIIEGDIYSIVPDKCEQCGLCIDECLAGAIIEK